MAPFKAPWGARSSSFPGCLRLSASSRVLFLMFSAVWLGLAPSLVLRSSASRPLLRSGRGLGLCRLLAPPGAGRAVPSLCGAISAAPPWAAPSCCASAPAGAACRLRRAVTLSTVSVTLLPLVRQVPAYTKAAHMAAWWVDCSVCLVAASLGPGCPWPPPWAHSLRPVAWAPRFRRRRRHLLTPATPLTFPAVRPRVPPLLPSVCVRRRVAAAPCLATIID